MLPFDLHVLGLPPAFNLSHDQTLQFNLLPLPQRARGTVYVVTPRIQPNLGSDTFEINVQNRINESLVSEIVVTTTPTSAHTSVFI